MSYFSTKHEPIEGYFRLDRHTHFEYLERSNRPGVERVRHLIEEWLSRYPTERQSDWFRRFSTGQFEAAFFELLLHEWATRSGLEIEVEPSISGSARKPDFLMTNPSDGSTFYLEATTASGQSESERGVARLEEEINGAIADIHRSDFFVGIEIEGPLEKSISSRRLQAATRSWLDSLDYEQLRGKMEAKRETFSSKTINIDGCKIVLEAYPMQRGVEALSILGSPSTKIGWVDTGSSVAKAVESKSNKYPDLGKPLIVAVNCSYWWADTEDVLDSLFGFPTIVEKIGTDDPRSMRLGGILGNAKRPQLTRVSGVLTTQAVDPYDFPRRAAQFVSNPAAALPLSCPFSECREWFVEGDRLVSRGEDEILAKALGVSPSWPQ